MRALGEQIVLTVDLSSGRIVTESIGVDEALKFVGGRGMAARMLYQRLAPHTDPMSPDNVIILSAGALGGTLAPSAARTTIVSKSPATMRYLKSSAGGHWGAELRYAGYDHIVITGRSDRPAYLWIADHQVEILDASHLWGARTREAEGAIRAELGDDQIEVAIIGPAAENAVLFGAILLSSFNTAGRGGIGTILGAKKLKAVAVRGNGGIPVADVPRFTKLSKEISAEVAKDGLADVLRQVGVLGMMAEPVSAYNFRGIIGEPAQQLGGQHLADLGYFRAGLACTACGIGCRHFLRNDSSRHGPLCAGEPEVEPVAALGWQCGVTDTDSVLQASLLCDDLGLDAISTGHAIAWAMECYEKGLISPEEADGLELEWGNSEVLLELIGRIASREGLLGELLAEGTQRAAEEVGGDSWKWALQARGLEQSSPDPRVAKGYALGFAINPRGPDHLQGWTFAEYGATPEARALVKHVCGDESYAVPYASEKKAVLMRWHEDCLAISDALGICGFVTLGPYAMTPEKMAELLSAAWGIEIASDELMRAGRRIVTLERCFNCREGARRINEQHLPWRMMNEPVNEGPTAGFVTSPPEMDQMLDEYYELHDWDKETGCPTAKVLAALGLEEVCSGLVD